MSDWTTTDIDGRNLMVVGPSSIASRREIIVAIELEDPSKVRLSQLVHLSPEHALRLAIGILNAGADEFDRRAFHSRALRQSTRRAE